MKRIMVVGLALLLVAPFASAGDAGENQTIDISGTPIDAIVSPDVSSDGEDFTVEVTLETDAAGNGTTVHWIVQMCSNDGTCDPPTPIMDMAGNEGKWMGTITPIDDHSYINYEITLNYTDGETETFPEGGFGIGGKVWSDCWVSGSESGGDGCPDDDGFLGLPAPSLLITTLVGFSAALLAKRDD